VDATSGRSIPKWSAVVFLGVTAAVVGLGVWRIGRGPEWVAVYAALYAGFFTAAGSLGAVWLTQQGDEGRRAHERQLRDQDHEHDHRERLYGDRLAAYRAFAVAYTEHRRAHKELETAWGAFTHGPMPVAVIGQGEQTGPSDDAQDRRDRLSEALTSAEHSQRVMEDALSMLELVASPHVYDEADRLSALVQRLWFAQMAYARSVDGPNAVQNFIAVRECQEDVDQARAALRDAIRAELVLDTGVGREP
jgi:hypothetical protein